MNLIHEAIKKIKTLIWELDEDKLLNKDEIEKAKSELRRYFNKRTSPLLFRVRYVKDRLSNSSKDQKIGAKIDAIVNEAIKLIDDSGYAGVDAKNPIKKTRGRPKGTIHPMLSKKREVPDRPIYRFVTNESYSSIRDDIHRSPDYKIQRYEGITAPVAVEVIKLLISAAGKKKNEGWVKSEPNWRGAFQDDVYYRFRNEQIQVGTKKNGHLGEWRIITNDDFDTLSSAGRFHKRERYSCK